MDAVDTHSFGLSSHTNGTPFLPASDINLDRALGMRLEKTLETCYECGQQFMTKDSLDEHIISHPKSTKVICSICGHEVSTAAKLLIHERIHTGRKPFKCLVPGCLGAFGNMQGLRRHQASHGIFNKKNNIHCKRCDFSTPLKYNFDAHCQLHRVEDLRRKISGSSSSSKFQCKICSELFPTLIGLQRHHRFRHKDTYDPSRPFSTNVVYQCVFCEYRTSVESCLIIHTSCHVGSQGHFQCSRCPMTFTVPLELSNHMKSHYGNEEQ